MNNGVKKTSTAASVWTAVGLTLITAGVFAFVFAPVLFFMGEITEKAMAGTLPVAIFTATFGVVSVINGDHCKQ